MAKALYKNIVVYNSTGEALIISPNTGALKDHLKDMGLTPSENGILKAVRRAVQEGEPVPYKDIYLYVIGDTEGQSLTPPDVTLNKWIKADKKDIKEELEDNINSVDVPEEYLLNDKYTQEGDSEEYSFKNKDSKRKNNPINYSSNTLCKWLQDGKLYIAFNNIKNMTSIDYIASVSGIDFRTLNKYDTGYYEYLDKEDTERLLNTINTMMLPTKLHRGLDAYPEIIYRDYEPQNAERQAEKRAYSNKISEQLKVMREAVNG
ncbi:hypothetical protein [Romboutsia lituseburensis]|uniref:hypothetical protein n=1 Tax=Romboutsia lituseburensis TaxID=1537 RepID=UPI00215B1BE4|nr:hypothetical protein [Romboutsia lituseburensis]MCR8745238.1 hypothetical protein [Romboutsia lituseburensis]